ncbi:MAG: 3-dehydroquinate synthase [Turicibacter sp.]|nr:3-dehydroquinate synthase [Turicibacter sp.]
MKQLNVQTKKSDYPIYIGRNCLTKLTSFINQATQVIVITDETVYNLHYQTLANALGKEALVYCIKPGETSKCLEVYYDIQTFLIQNQVDRKALILAFGGGVVGDLAGFVAATYMRGIDFIQIPTTLLAHDSAIGGKVAINHELGKNLIGAFYPPKAVIYELPFLKTLSDKEWRSGLAEMIKHGYIADRNLLRELMAIQLLELSKEDSFANLLVQSLMVKKAVVEADEFEKGQRAFLNFGHTFGHAIELVEKDLSHGEAIAIGMIFALYLSEKTFQIDLAIKQYIHYLKQLGYPLLIKPDHAKEYLNYMLHDKKNEQRKIRFVLLKDIENPVLVTFNEEKLRPLLEEFLNEMMKEVSLCH